MRASVLAVVPADENAGAGTCNVLARDAAAFQGFVGAFHQEALGWVCFWFLLAIVSFYFALIPPHFFFSLPLFSPPHFHFLFLPLSSLFPGINKRKTEKALTHSLRLPSRNIKKRRVKPAQVLLDEVPALTVERSLVVRIRVVVRLLVESVFGNFGPP